MTTFEALTSLVERGVRVWVDGSDLVLEPADRIPPDMVGHLREHKAELVERLRLQPDWPSDVAAPPWWPEFVSILGGIRLLEARRQRCGDPVCGFGVAVQWEYNGDGGWSCPKCGRSSDPTDQGDDQGRDSTDPHPYRCVRCGAPVRPRVQGRSVRVKCFGCGWSGGFTVAYLPGEDPIELASVFDKLPTFALDSGLCDSTDQSTGSITTQQQAAGGPISGPAARPNQKQGHLWS